MTAGAAYAEADILGNDFNDLGWVAGIGAEYMVPDIVTVGAEVLYDDFDNSGTDLSRTTLSAKVSFRF